MWVFSFGKILSNIKNTYYKIDIFLNVYSSAFLEKSQSIRNDDCVLWPDVSGGLLAQFRAEKTGRVRYGAPGQAWGGGDRLAKEYTMGRSKYFLLARKL